MAGICKIRLANFIENHHIPFVKILSLFLQNFVHSLHSKIRRDGEPCFLSITAYTSQCFHGGGVIDIRRYFKEQISKRFHNSLQSDKL